MIEESVAHKTARTSFWAGIEKMLTMGVQFIVSIVLARLLSPSDYGIIAMLNVFVQIAGEFISCGFENALIRKQDCTSKDFNTAFIFNVIVGIVSYVILFISAPFISDFYNMEILCPVLRVCSVSLVLSAFTRVPYTILTKHLEARKQAVITTYASFISAIVGISAAYAGYGVWSLVYQQLVSSFIMLVMFYVNTKWFPSFEYSRESMKYLWNFGSKMLATGIISSIYRNIYSIVIGKNYSSASLGLFNRGQQTATLFPNIIESVLLKSSLPILSQLQGDNDKLIRVYREMIKLTCFITFPLVCLIGVLADPFVEFILTDKWSGCIIYIKIFAITSLLSPANSVNLNLLQVYGRSDYTLKAEIIKKMIGLVAVFLMLPFGVFWLSIVSSLMGVFAYVVNLYYAKKLSGLKYLEQIKDMLPFMISSIVMYIIVLLFKTLISNTVLQLFLGGIFGFVIYVFFTKYIYNCDIYDKIRNLIK